MLLYTIVAFCGLKVFYLHAIVPSFLFLSLQLSLNGLNKVLLTDLSDHKSVHKVPLI